MTANGTQDVAVVTAVNLDGGREVLSIGVATSEGGPSVAWSVAVAGEAPRHLLARMPQTWPKCDVDQTRVTAPASDSEPEWVVGPSGFEPETDRL